MADTTIRVFSAEQYDGNFPPQNLEDFQAWLTKQIASIPTKFRSNASIEISNRTFYDSTYATVEISYTRPMTAAESDARDEANKRAAADKEMRLRATYAELKARFEA